MKNAKSVLPKQSTLLEGMLVDFTSKHKDIATNSLKIANKLDVRHSDVTAAIRRLSQKGLIDVRTSSHIYLDNSNREQSYFQLNEQAALQVIMNLKGPKADLLHKEIARIFISMREELSDWKAGRLQATESTKIANDSIIWLKDELKKVIPKSNRCKMLFVHIQQGINKTVTGSAKTDRSLLNKEQLEEISTLEIAVRRLIERLKADGMPVEQIRDEVMLMIKAA